MRKVEGGRPLGGRAAAFRGVRPGCQGVVCGVGQQVVPAGRPVLTSTRPHGSSEAEATGAHSGETGTSNDAVLRASHHDRGVQSSLSLRVGNCSAGLARMKQQSYHDEHLLEVQKYRQGCMGPVCLEV